MSFRQVIIPLCILSIVLIDCRREKYDFDLLTPFEKSDSAETATYEEGIAWWQRLDSSSPFVCVREFGETDAGRPLHIVKIEAEENCEDVWENQSNKLLLLINNGIHPGEADGIDASMVFARELVEKKDFREKYRDVIILIIPFYNVGGALNRNCCSRASQNGPPEYGFRGNARNLDLNRDFIKCGSREAKSFSQLIRDWDPDIYLETHVSNGADYQYTMTYLLSHTDKMMPALKEFCAGELEPYLLSSMKDKEEECIPYVNVWKNSPDSGFPAFYDTPRYSTGYLNLFNTIGLLTETHMLKPFRRRVEATITFLESVSEFASGNARKIKSVRNTALEEMMHTDSLALDWTEDFSKYESIGFKGYRAYYEESNVTGAEQLYYDRSAPWEKTIPYYRYLLPGKKVRIPEYYVVPAAWTEVVELLRNNGVAMDIVEVDTAMHLEEYRIEKFETSDQPYEGHYFHHGTEVSSRDIELSIRKKEYYLVPTGQAARRFIVEVLEPEAPDSYFNWNFFDEILQQKEWFSAYVFDGEAENLLKDPVMKSKFDSVKSARPELAENPTGRLYEVYKLSDRYEKDRHMVYPVYRSYQ